jgi:CelD/BcsL family acetyltransferase involved in cellulose biosynthesis
MTLRRRLFWREAIALGGENTEYDPVLVAPRPDAETLLRAAWTFAKRRSGFALATVPFIDQASPVYAILPQGSRRRKEHTLPAPIVRFGEFANWDAYWRSRSANLRNGMNRRRRRLAECGAVTSRWIEDDAEYEELLDWALACKRDWLKQQGLASDHIGQDTYRAFLLAARQADIPNGRLAMMAMHIDQVPIAVKIGCIDPTRFEGFITTYDPAWSAHSPGQLLLADCLAWCQETGRDYDFRIGEETYKSGWTSDARLVSRVTITNGVAGGIIIGADTLSRHFRAVGDRLRQAIPLPWRRRAKALFTPVILQPLPAEA